ncbi:MAG: glycosyltransferase [Bacteroidota bacterium]
MPEISVIMPVYNGERFVAEAIESVIGQTYRDFELIIVNDGSTDGTAVILEQYRNRTDVKIKIIQHPANQGVSAAQNSGIAICSGKYLMFAGADDIQEPERLEKQFRVFEEQPWVDMVFADCIFVDECNRSLNRQKGYPEGMTSENAILFQLKRNHLFSGLVLLRKTPDIWFDITLPNAVDYELFIRLLLADYKLAVLNQPLARCRVHTKNISGQRKVSGKSVERILSRLDYPKILADLSRRFPESEVRLAVAGATLAANLPEKALEYLQDVSFEPEAAILERAFTMGVCYYRLGNYAKSLECFQTAIQMKPDDPAVLNNLGVLTVLTGGSQTEAMVYFQKALVLREGYLDATYNLDDLKAEKNTQLRITERQLRPSFVHAEHYQL